MTEKKRHLTGLIAAPFTPMTEKGEINVAVIGDYVKHLVKSKVSGVFICGTTGESASLTTEERETIAEAWVKNSKGGLKVVVHVGGTSLPQSIRLAAHAQSIGADAVAAMAPYFFKPDSAKALVDFMAPVAKAASSLPFFYYNMPSITGVDLPVSEFLSEAENRISNLAGIKYTHTNLMDMQKCINFGGGKYEILNGFDEILIAGLSVGAVSAVGSTYNYMPSIYLNIMAAMERKDLVEARKYQMMSIKAMDVIFKHGGGVRSGKAMMNLLGVDCGPCRLPLASFPKEEYIALKKELDMIGFFKMTE